MMKYRKRQRLLRCVVLAAACTAAGAAVQASNADTMHDIPAGITSLRNARDEIRYRHQAEADAAQATRDLQSSRKNAAEAVKNRQEAANNLAAAKENISSLTQSLRQTQQALSAAQAVENERAQAVAAARQAVAAYAPDLEAMQQEVEAKRSTYENLEGQAQNLSQEYEEAVQHAEVAQEADREQRVAEAVNAVGYELNRLEEAKEMADAQETNEEGEVEAIQRDYDEQLSAMDDQLEAASDDLDAAQDMLDTMQEHMDALRDALAEAEELEAESREEVAGYKGEITNLSAELIQADKEEAEAEQYDREAQDWMNRAVSDEGQMIVAAQLQAYALEHFGEWSGFSLGMEYYHWKGEHSGHQLFLPLAYAQESRIRGRKVDFGISTGYIRSDTGLPHGTAAGMSDTQLSIMVHNDHPVNSTRYLFDFNLPTGQHAFYQHAIVPEGLAHFTDFGAGFEFTPGWEAVHQYNEEDSLTGRLQYTFRSGYTYAKEIGGRKVSPGDTFRQELQYQHAGPEVQYAARMIHSSNSSAAQDSIVLDEVGIWHSGDTLHYTDGDEWELRFFYNRSLTARNEMSLYTIQNVTGKTKGINSEDAHSQYYGVGWMHHINEKREWHAWLHYKDTSSSYDPLRLDLNSTGYRRYAAVMGYSWQYSPSETLSLDIECYTRHNNGANSYQGWGIVVMYNKNL